MSSDLHGTVIQKTTENFSVLKLVCKSTLLSNIFTLGYNIFPINFSVKFIGTTDLWNSLKREDLWRKALTTVVPLGLNIEDSVFTITIVTYDSINIFDCFWDIDFWVLVMLSLSILLFLFLLILLQYSH